MIFPVSQNESRGIEDLRLVKFSDDDGSTTIYGTYTAFNGYTIFPTLLVVRNPTRIQSHTMSGRLCTQQRNGDLPPEDQRPLCHVGPA